LSGFFASYARPEESRPFRIERIIPKAQVENGRNVFVAEARIGGRADWIRPGLEGVAKIQVGRRGVWWITLHRAIDYLRMNFLL
ncbi:MAG: diguanylate cyclase, partial [Planctomycetes bacterium]|nr:diguanylate cyclase [Planctomycetota bacterium]